VLQLGIGLLIGFFLVVFLTYFYNWNKDNQVQEDFNDNDKKFEYQQNRALYVDGENSISLLKDPD
jgi:hypothetical protein